MSDSKIIKAATTNHSADYVIILERKTDYHPITGRGSNFVEVRVIKPINEDGQTFSATPSTNELTPKVGIVAVDYEVKVGNEVAPASFSDSVIKQILISPDEFSASSDLGRDTVRTFVSDGIDVEDLRKAFKGLRVGLENEEIPILRVTSINGSRKFVKQPYGFINWAIAHKLDDMTRLRKIKEGRSNVVNLGVN